MVEVKRNTFFKRYDMASSGVVQLNALYKDVPIGTSSATFKLQGKAQANRYVVSGVVADTPSVGGAEVIGGNLMFYCSGTSLSKSATLPKIATYKIKDDITIAEGSFGLSTSGTNTNSPGQIDVYTSYVDSSAPYVQENFDGADKTLGEIDFMAINAAGGITISSKAYVDLSDSTGDDAKSIASNLFVGGHASMFYSDTDSEEGAEFLLYNFGELGEGSSTTVEIRQNVKRSFTEKMQGVTSPFAYHKRTGRLFIKPQKKSKPQGLWKNKDDNRTEAAVYTAYPPYWRHTKIKPYMKYEHTAALPEMGETDTTLNPNNSIFNKFGGTIDSGTPWEAGGVNPAPYIMQKMELTKEKFDTGGQSMLLHEYWTFSTTAGNKYSSDIFGTKGAVNNQFMMASMNTVPFPMPLDFALTSEYQDLNGAANIGAQNTQLIKPEMNITFSVEELDSMPGWRQNQGKIPGDDTYSNDVYCIDYVSGASEGASSSALPVNMINSANQWQSISHNTLKRSFTVTLSNYEPEDGETMDDFIHRGMLNFYCDVEPDGYTATSGTPLIVGGFTLKTRKVVSQTNTESADSNKITAYPLITRPSHWIASGGSSAGYGWTVDTYNKNYRGRPSFLWSGASGYQMKTFINGGAKLKQPSGSANMYEPSVDLSFNEWINAKIVFDTNEKNSWSANTDGTNAVSGYFATGDDGAGPTAKYSKASHARLCKAYFTKGTLTTGASAPADTTDQAPSIYVYFPCREGSGSTAQTNWDWTQNPEYWPNVMTLWLNNFRYFTDQEATYSVSGTAGGWGGVTTLAKSGRFGVGRESTTTMNDASGINASVTTITGTATTSFPESGSIIIEPGTAKEECVKYASSGSNTFGTCIRGVNGTIAVAHDDGVTIVGGGEPTTGDGKYDTGTDTPDGTDIYRDYYGMTNEYVPDPQDEDNDGNKDLGTGRQAKVYVDNIDFRNFNYDILDNSAGSGAFSMPAGWSPITATTPVSGGAAGSATRRSGEASVGGTNMATPDKLYVRNAPTYITLGFDSLLDLPILGKQTDVTTDVSDDSLGDSGIGTALTAGTPLTISGLTSTTGLTEDATYYVSSSGISANVIRVYGPVSDSLNDAKAKRLALSDQYVALGGSDDTGVTVNSPGYSAAGWLMFNGYNQKNFQDNLYNDGWGTQAFKSMTKDGTAGNDSFVNYLGGQALNAGNTSLASTYKSPATIQGIDIDFSTAATGDATEVNTMFPTTGTAGSGTISNDGFSQKGTTYLSVSGNQQSWAKRENIFVGARVMGIPNFTEVGGTKETDEIAANTISVDNPSLFKPGSQADGPHYVIWKAMETGTSSQITGNAKIASKRSKRLSVKEVEGPFVTFNEEYDSEDLVNIKNLPYLWAGPMRYWITMQMFPGPVNVDTSMVGTDVSAHAITQNSHGLIQGTPVSFSGLDNTTTPANDTIYYVSPTTAGTHTFDISTTPTGDAGGDVSFVGSDDAAYVTMTVYNIGPYRYGTQGGGKAYDNICILDNPAASKPALADTGSTWNEASYFYNTGAVGTGGRAAVYGKPWILDVTSGSQLDLGLDFGWGAYDDEAGAGGQVDIKTPYVGYFTELNVNGLIGQSALMPTDDFKMVVGLHTPTVNQSVEFVNADYSSTDASILKPHFLWQYFDSVPVVTELAVGPMFPVLPTPDDSEGVNLYELSTQDLRSLRFSWSEDADDIWYRMLMIDASGSTIKNKYHNAKLVIHGNEVPAQPTSNPSTLAYDYTSAAVTSGSCTVGSDVRSVVTGIQGYTIQTASSSTAANGVVVCPSGVNTAWKNLTEWTFVCHLIPSSDDSGHDCYYIAHGTDIEGYIEGTDGTIKFVLNGNILQSVSRVAYDGLTPTNVVVTYNANATDGRYTKLYIDGVLEDVDTNTHTVTSNADTTLGAQTTPDKTSAYRGFIEEVIVYDKCYEIPESAGDYVYKNSILADKNSDNEYLTHSAKLFCYDYTNIRGTTPQEIGSSKQVNWKVTTA